MLHKEITSGIIMFDDTRQEILHLLTVSDILNI